MKADITHSLAVRWTSRLNRRVNKEGTDLQKMILGVEILLHTIPKLVLVVVSALILGILPQVLATWIPFEILRKYVRGLHAGSNFSCTIVSLVAFVAVPYAVQNIEVHVGILLLTYVLVGIGVYKYAPADTAARPVIGEKQRGMLKKKALGVTIIIPVLTVILLDNTWYILVAIGAALALVFILPVTYRVMGRTINNYERYERQLTEGSNNL